MSWMLKFEIWSNTLNRDGNDDERKTMNCEIFFENFVAFDIKSVFDNCEWNNKKRFYFARRDFVKKDDCMSNVDVMLCWIILLTKLNISKNRRRKCVYSSLLCIFLLTTSLTSGILKTPKCWFWIDLLLMMMWNCRNCWTMAPILFKNWNRCKYLNSFFKSFSAFLSRGSIFIFNENEKRFCWYSFLIFKFFEYVDEKDQHCFCVCISFTILTFFWSIHVQNWSIFIVENMINFVKRILKIVISNFDFQNHKKCKNFLI